MSNRDSGKKKTREEKEKSKNEYLNRIKARASQKGLSAKSIYVDMYKAEVWRLIFEVDAEKEALLVYYNHGTKEMPIKGAECYILPPGTGMLPKNMCGIGSKFAEEDATEQQQGDEFSKYNYNMKVGLGLGLPDEVYEQCPDALTHVKKSIEFLEARNKLFVEKALEFDNVYTIFKNTCREQATEFCLDKFKLKKAAAREGEDGDEPADEDGDTDELDLSDPEIKAEFDRIYKSHFSGGINFGMKFEKFQDEETKKNVKFLQINLHSRTFMDNTGEEMPEEVEKEIKEGKNVFNKPIAEVIKRAYAAKKKLARIPWTDQYDKPLQLSIFDYRFNAGATVVCAIKMSGYNRGKNRGTTIFIQKGSVLYNTEYSHEDPNTNNHLYVKAKPRTLHEVMLLTMFKHNVKLADGMSATTITKALDSKKLKQDDITKALTTLMADRYVVHGKDKTYFKLADPELNVETIPVETPPAAAPAPAGDKGGKADKGDKGSKKRTAEAGAEQDTGSVSKDDDAEVLATIARTTAKKQKQDQDQD